MPTYLIMVTRLYGTAQFGVYLLAWTVIDFTSRLGTMGLSDGIVRFVAQYWETGETGRAHALLRRTLLLVLSGSLVWAGIVVLLAPLLSRVFFPHHELSRAITLFALGLPALCLLNLLIDASKARRLMQYDLYVRGILVPISMLVFALFFFFLGWGLQGLIGAHVLALVLGCAVAFYFGTRLFSVRECLTHPATPGDTRALLKFALPLGCNHLLNGFVAQLDVLMLGHFVTPAALGIYGAASKLAFQFRKIRQVFAAILSPIISSLSYQKQWGRLGTSFRLAARWSTTLNLLFLGLMLVFGRSLLKLFGAEFSAGFTALVILALGQSINGMIGLSGYLILMTGYSYLNLINSLFVVILQFVLNLLLIPRYGITGAALITATAAVTVTVIEIVEGYLMFTLVPLQRSLLKPAAAMVLAAIGAWGLYHGLAPYAASWLPLSLGVIVYISIFRGALAWFGLDEVDRTMLQRLRNRLASWRRTLRS